MHRVILPQKRKGVSIFHILVGVLGLVLAVAILIEGFETVVQPRRVARRYRISRVYYVLFWWLWRWVADAWCHNPRKRAAFLSTFGPLSLLGIFTTWTIGLIFAFAMLHWGLRDSVQINGGSGPLGFGTYLYLSGTTFFTLGYGDVTPIHPIGRVLAVAESGLGFGFLAAILSYLPALFQAYSRREVSISLLDARAGSPPTAMQLILRAARANNISVLEPFLAEWERWAAELLESQLSFPVLAYYRSQHDNQSWVAALATILDTCAVMMTQMRSRTNYQAQVTFAIARHAAVDLALVLRANAPDPAKLVDRLKPLEFEKMRSLLEEAKVELSNGEGAEESLRALRQMYEPFIQALATKLLLPLPLHLTDDSSPDNWQRSAWMKPTPGIGALPVATPNEGHFG